MTVEKKPTKRRAPMKVYPGMQIHSWTVIARLPIDRKTKSPNLRRRVRVKCVCGTIESLPLYYLTRKEPKKSCGCLNRGIAAQNKLEYRVWYMMNTRCSNPKHKSYKDYGGRGIEVCERWRRGNPHGFANFLKDMGPRKYITLTLDRIDVNGPYAPVWNGQQQCRWATWDEQAANKRDKTVPVTVDVPPEEEGYLDYPELRAVDEADPNAPPPEKYSWPEDGDPVDDTVTSISCEPIDDDGEDADLEQDMED